jgi:hypothetical protein
LLGVDGPGGFEQLHLRPGMRLRAPQEGMLIDQTVAEHTTPEATDFSVSSPARCPGAQPSGRRCRAKPGPSGFCHLHDPANAERLAVARKLGGVIAGTRRVHIEIDLSTREGVRAALEDVIREVARGRLSPSAGNTITAAINTGLRLAELELEAKVIAIEKAIQAEIDGRKGRSV